jgi:surfeit locus 1 family protein
MRIGQRQFKPSLIGIVATLIMMPLLMSLGFWQLGRADEKRALIDRLHVGQSSTQTVDGGNAEQLPLLQQAIASGRYDAERQILLDNMWSTKNAQVDGKPVGVQPGVNVWTPLVLEDGHVLIVNRGWRPFGRTRSELPNIEVGGEPRSIRGMISGIPEPGLRISNKQQAMSSWPRLLNYPTLAELREIYGDKLLPRILLLDSAESDGYERDWSTRYSFNDFGPDKHIGYAFQWFGMSFAVFVIFVVVSLKPLQRETE